MSMTNNDIMKRLRYALRLDDATMMKMFSLVGGQVTLDELLAMLKNEEEEGYANCSDKNLSLFLDGLIVIRRGRKDDGKGPRPLDLNLDNNLILKKLRIAMNFKDDDMISTLTAAGAEVSKSELNALFRKQGHRNYQECGDQFLLNFIKGLELRFQK